ncbi:hypothetical protein [Bacillus sp. V33-4]|uniref:hypothetical protein n=1 Tax=Bacillus sp. V33-4 TaxID=2054169 RepID=UPI000C780751|nr:hypothetical protein [Bacillus sp. V33-4]PLR83665.1 hypothetical protein CVD23_13605 [Bacillus sp. V33-4]
MSYITVGRFTLPADLIAAIVAIVISALVYKLLNKKSIGDWYWNSLFIYIAVFKLSYALFNFKLFVDTPLSLIYFNGGMKGQILAAISLAVYTLFLSRKTPGMIRNEYVPIYLMFFLLYEMTLYIVEKNVAAVAFQFFILIVFYILYLKNSKSNRVMSTKVFILLILLEALLLSLFDGLIAAENLPILLIGLLLTVIQNIKKEASYHE